MASLLRELTRAEHARVDFLYSRFRLHEPQGYASFLSAQRAAYCSIEAELERAGVGEWIVDWPARRRGELLLADLRELGLEAPGSPFSRRLTGLPQILGAAYVLEGSRLGGKVLAQRLYPQAPRRFLGAPGSRSGWPRLVSLLNRSLLAPADLQAAAAAAKACFECFERSALQNGEQEIA